MSRGDKASPAASVGLGDAAASDAGGHMTGTSEGWRTWVSGDDARSPGTRNPPPPCLLFRMVEMKNWSEAVDHAPSGRL